MEEMTSSISALSALLIGGGQIVRFDKGYPTPTPTNVDLPFAYWLTPAVLAALVGKPVIWNAVGASMDWPHAPWHDELIRNVLTASYFIGVRDVLSRNDLAKVAPDARIQLLPDTAFGLSRLWPLEKESPEFSNWRKRLGLESKYVVIQANTAVGQYRAAIETLLESMGKINVVVLPICWCHGDRAEKFPQIKGRVFRSCEWLAPKLTSEIIGRSEFVFASSLHACITALSYGVPVARVTVSWGRSKWDLLDEFSGIAHINQGDILSGLINRGRLVEPRVIAHADHLDRYWDEVKDVVLRPPIEHCTSSMTSMLTWVAKVSGAQRRLGLAPGLVETLRESLARYPNKRVALKKGLSLSKSLLVVPFQWISRHGPSWIAARGSGTELRQVQRSPLAERGADPILELDRITQGRMETEPFQWVFIDRLFSEEKAAALVASYPHDKFKKVVGYNGEKGYEYMSRSLIHMEATTVSDPEGLSPAWRALARDLLSADYRSALTRITGRDLTSAVLEVNVFHYGPGAWLGPHVDLKEKIMTHVLYFNETWDRQHGGCLNILRSSDPSDVFAEIAPVVGSSVLLVRSKRSWHSVSRVAQDWQTSRRSVNVIFHLPGSVSTMWPPRDHPVLQDYPLAS